MPLIHLEYPARVPASIPVQSEAFTRFARADLLARIENRILSLNEFFGPNIAQRDSDHEYRILTYLSAELTARPVRR